MYTIVDLCLLCLTNSKTLINILSEDIDDIPIEQKLKYVLVELKKTNPEIPRHICLPCLENINYVYSYKRQCLRNIHKLNTYIDSLKSAVEPCRNLQIKLIDIKHLNLVPFICSNEDISDPIKPENFDNLDIPSSEYETETQHIPEKEVEKEIYNVEKDTDNNDGMTNKKQLLIKVIDDQMKKLDLGLLDEKKKRKYTKTKAQKKDEQMVVDDDSQIKAEVFVNDEPGNITEEIDIKSESEYSQNGLSYDVEANTLQDYLPYEVEANTLQDELQYKVKANTLQDELPYKVEANTLQDELPNNVEANTLQDELPYEVEANTSLGRLPNNIRPNTDPSALSSKEIYYCPECHKTFTKKFCFESHFHLKHTSERAYRCDICNKGFHKKSRLLDHLRSNANNDSHGEKEVRPHVCTVCNKAFKRRDALRKHLKTHNLTLEYKCDSCDSVFVTYNALLSHKRAQNCGAILTCHICSKHFADQAGFTQHKATHGKEWFYCEFCSKVFANSSSLALHMKCHEHEEAKKDNDALIKKLLQQ